MRRADNYNGEVTISRMGSNETTLEIVDDETKVGDALERAGLSVSSSETIWVNGEKATVSDVLNDEDTIQIVGKKEGGLK